MPAIAEQGFTWANTQHLLAIFNMTASPGQDNHAVNQMRQARHTDRYLALEWEGCQHSKHLGEAWDLLAILWKVQGPIPQVHPRDRKGGSAHSLCAQAPFLSSHWRRTKHQGPEQRNLYTALSLRRLLGPVFFSSRAVGIQWAETLPPCPTVATQMSILHRGS